MADIIGQETWTADGKDYVIKVTEPGATVTENAISIISPVRHRKGKLSNGPLEPILASQLDFTIRDNTKLFRTAIDGKEIGDIVLEFTEDGNTLFKGFVIPEFQRSLAWKSNPEYKISAYDGINGLKGFTWDVTGEKTLRSMIFEICDKIGLSLVYNILFDWEHDSKHVSTSHIDALRNRAEHLLNEGGTYYDALKMLCEFFNAQFFQAGGEWYFMQRHMRDGTSMTNYPSTGGTETVDYLFNITDSDLHRSSTFFSYHPANARIVSKHTYPSYLLKNADWSEGNKYWDNFGGVAGSNANRRRLESDGDYLIQTIGETFIDADGTEDRLAVTFTVYVSIDGAATGTHSLDYCELKAEATDGTTYYITSASAWQLSTQTYRSQSIDFGTNSGTTFSFVVSFTTPIVPLEPMKLTLKLYGDKSATGNASDINWIEFSEIKVVHLRPDEVDDVLRAEELVVTEETGKAGENLEEEFQIGDTDDNTFYGPGVWEYTTDGTTWLPTQEWEPDSNGIHAKRADNIKTQTQAKQEFYEFKHKFGDRPDLHNTLTYESGTDITRKIYIPTFLENIYERNAKVASRTAAIEQLGATILTLSDLYFTASKQGVSGAPDHGIYKIEAPDDVSSVPWVSNSTYWNDYLIDGNSAAEDMEHIKVDFKAGYVFTQGQENRYLYRQNLDGTGSIDNGETTYAMCICRETERVYGFGGGLVVKEYDYDLNFIRNVYTRSGADVNGLGVDQSGTYLLLHDLNVVSTTNHIVRVDLSTLATTTIATYVENSVVLNSTVIDEDEGIAFTSISDGPNLDIFSFPFPAGGSLTSIKANIGTALALDRVNQKVIYSDGSGNIEWMDYNGSNQEEILTLTSVLDVDGVDVGMS